MPSKVIQQTGFACVRIDHVVYFMPTDKAFALAKLLCHAQRGRETYSPGLRYHVEVECPDVEINLVKREHVESGALLGLGPIRPGSKE